ncbi:MAG: hypothetical protein AAF438_21210, partial [Pseudomonadota bacterium]
TATRVRREVMTKDVLSLNPTQLGEAREVSHVAVQWVSKAARANLTPEPDDSHSNFGWDAENQALVSHVLDDDHHQMGFSFNSASMLWLEQGSVVDRFPLESADDSAIQQWCDQNLAKAGLSGTDNAEMPYSLEPKAQSLLRASLSELETLGHWFHLGFKALTTLVDQFESVAVNSPTVRCWPHHYDVGTLFYLEAGNPENAQSIGVGLSPGDESYPEPYFYCNPWPVPRSLVEVEGPLRWHTEGFTSLVLPASAMTNVGDIDGLLVDSFTTVQKTLATNR